MAPKQGEVRKEVSDDAKELARDMARDMLDLSKAAWRLSVQVGKVGMRMAEEAAQDAERNWQRRRGGKSNEK